MPYVDPNCTWWNGALDDIAIWNRALSSNEIAQLYAAQSTPSGGSGSTSSASGSFPSGIPFQAVVRDSTGQPISNQPLTVRFSILDSAGYTSALYTETHSVTTNPLGLFTAVVGNGTASGTPFDSLSWDGSGKYLKVEIDRGTGYSTLITQPMQSVPYAIRARSADKISNQYLPVYLNNAAALAAGLHPGDMYRTPTGVLMVVY
jgi:hypothetical protein